MKNCLIAGLVIALGVALVFLYRQILKTSELESVVFGQEAAIKALKEKNSRLNCVVNQWVAERKEAEKKAGEAQKKVKEAKKKPEVKAWADESIPQDVLDILRDGSNERVR